MIYLLKFTLASGLLWGLYHLWLEQEKMHRFKRFYLLFSLLFAAMVPLLQLPGGSKGAVAQAIGAVELDYVLPPPQTTLLATSTEPVWSAFFLLPWVYALISGFLLLRYGFGLYQLAQRSRAYSSQTHGQYRVAFLPDNGPAHSFLRTVYISKEDYEHPQLSPVILGHELAHLRQGHSFDLLLIELLRVFFWFNPFLFLYKRAIQLNHEFLADEAVLQEQKLETSTYQLLLLSKIVPKQSASLAHAFDYSITKKRLIMMTKMAKPQWLWFKQLALLPLLAGLALLLCEKIQAQGTAKAEPPKVLAQNSSNSKQEGVSQALLDEYNTEVQRIKDSIEAKRARNTKWINLTDIKIKYERLNAIYYHMSPEQRANAPVIDKALPSLPPVKKAPTAADLQTWLSPEYGVWIDDRKVDNKVLKNYTADDFALVWQSKLMKNAIPPGSPRRFQLNLYTHAGYQKTFIDARKL